MMTAHRQARALQSVDAEIKADPFGYARQIAGPVDCGDAERFPEIALALAHAAALATPEPRSQGEDHV